MDKETKDAFDALMKRINDSHEKLTLDLRDTQADVRSMKAEQTSLPQYMRTLIDARATQTETLINRLFDRVHDRIDQSERSIEERLTHLERKPGTGD